MHCIGDEASLQSRTAACLLSRSFLWSRLQGKGQWNISLHLILTVVILLNLWPTAQPSIELFSEGDSGSWHTLTPPPLLKDVLRNRKTNNHNPDKQSNLLGYLSSHNVDTRQLGALLCNHGLEPSPRAGPWLLGCRRVVFVAIWVRTLVRVGRRNVCYLKHPRVSFRVYQTGSSWRLELLREVAFCRTSGFHPNDFGMSVITEHQKTLKFLEVGFPFSDLLVLLCTERWAGYHCTSIGDPIAYLMGDWLPQCYQPGLIHIITVALI